MRSKLVSLVASVLLCATAYAGDSGSSAPVAEDVKPDATVSPHGWKRGGRNWLYLGSR